MPPVRRPIAPKGPSKATLQPSPSTTKAAPGSIFAPRTPTSKSAGTPPVPGHQVGGNQGQGQGG
jgi:hypothetical protein